MSNSLMTLKYCQGHQQSHHVKVVVWPCGHVRNLRSENIQNSERKKRKSPFSTTTLSFDTPSPANPRENPHKTYLAIETRIPGLHFCRGLYGSIFIQILVVDSENDDFGTNRKRVFDFLLVTNSNLCRILHRYGDTAA